MVEPFWGELVLQNGDEEFRLRGLTTEFRGFRGR